MPDEEKTKTEKNGNEPNEAPKKSSGFVKYIMLGGGALVIVVLASFLTLMLLKEEPKTEEPLEEPGETLSQDVKQGDESELLESLFSESDPSILEEIQSNLAFLDYEPSKDEIVTEDMKMSVEDSVEAVNWLEAEKIRLAEKEKELNARQKEMELLDKQVSQKILKIEQAESSRIQNLAKLYDGMDARSVAKLMANLDNETVVSILPRMKTKNASAVLSLLPAKRAAVLSKKMITIAEN